MLNPPDVQGEWGQAAVWVELRRGTLVPLGPGVRLAYWPLSPKVRATALAPWYTKDLAACLDTAAWIWGACRWGEALPAFTVLGCGRPSASTGRLREIHEFSLNGKDTRRLNSFAVTTPLRTAYDLLRDPGLFTFERRVACRLLVCRAEAVARFRARVLGPDSSEAARSRTVSGVASRELRRRVLQARGPGSSRAFSRFKTL